MAKATKSKKAKATQPEARTVPQGQITVEVPEASHTKTIHDSALMTGEPALESTTINKENPSQDTTQTDRPYALEEKVADASPMEETLELLAFRLADEEYAVDLLKVKEITRLTDITHVPRTATTIKGIISLRGVIIPVFDLRVRLGLKESPPDRKARIIVVMMEKGLMGLIVDEVAEVFKIKASEIEPPPSIVGGSEAEHLIGVTRYRGRLLILLDLEKALSLRQ